MFSSPDVLRVEPVSVSPSAEIVENSSVTLTCSSDANPAAKYTWYKENGGPDLHPLSKERQLIFRSIQSSDSGEYYCTTGNRTFFSKYISLDVNYPPKLPSVSVSPSAEIVENSSVNLTCSSDANPAANYTWYKENEDSPKASGQIFTITDSRPEHSGNYYCEAQNRRGRHNSTLHLIVVAGTSPIIINIIRLTVMFLLLIPLLLLSLWTRKKNTRSSTTEPHEPVEMIEFDSCPTYENASDFTAAQTEDTEEQEDTMQMSQSLDPPDGSKAGQLEEQGDLQYASIHFSNNQADSLYSNIRAAQPLRHMEQQDVSEYATVKINSARTAPRTRGQKTEENPAALYSTVNKTR
ncbi:hypothetical protein D5F01_LYC00712 [Larimichthys crocea]|uniref:Ig-like domain-containing protein n=1 Tax=Larimichthys crocea TaxID=215358 RepID=A0A6G0JAD8_LARCR|nr:hypothetical protein D5F01_LYC00712 [Larimichthys crocea]